MLRDYQTKLADDIRAELARGIKRVLTVSPTGSGKTEVFTFITQGATEKGNVPLILVHRRRLVQQINERLAKYGTSADVKTIQSKPDASKYKLIIIDEAHRSMAAGYQDLIWANPQAAVLGFTATPERRDGKGLGDVYQAIVQAPQYKQLMDAGWLAKPVCYAPYTPDLTGVRVTAGDYNVRDLDAALARSQITGSALEHYKKLAAGKKALGFCVSIAASIKAADEFTAAGVTSGVVHGKMKQSEIDAVFRRLDKGLIKVVFSCDLLTEGYDCPSVECIIGMRPTHSLIFHLQMIGRGSRKFDGKDGFIVLDHAGNFSKHGLITQHREWSLEGRKKKKRSKLGAESEPIKVCTQCYFAHDPAPRCPSCGFIYPVVNRQPKQVEGQLVEITQEIKLQRKSEERGYKTLEDWLRLARERGYNDGWAYYRHKARSKRF